MEPSHFPEGTVVREWIDAEFGEAHQFPLQHAIDFVFVHESSAKRIAKAVRSSVGRTFFSPPVTTSSPIGTRQSSRLAPQTATASPPGAQPTQRHARFIGKPQEGAQLILPQGRKRRAESDSFYDSDSSRASGDSHHPSQAQSHPNIVVAQEPDLDTVQPTNSSGSDAKRQLHARIIASLAHEPDLLHHYLQAQQPSDRGVKHQRVEHVAPSVSATLCAIDTEGSVAPGKPSKLIFRPTAKQCAIHQVVSGVPRPGMSPHDFVDSLIDHAAVQFPPHPGTLMRLYDFQFGRRGLSILHFRSLDPIQKMEWVFHSGVNTLDFSAAVNPPKVEKAASVDDILSAVGALRRYCMVFGAPETIEVVQAMHSFLQQLIGLEMWAPADLEYLVYWVNGSLEKFRVACAEDVRTGLSSRQAVKDSISQSDPQYQSVVQMVLAKKVNQLLQASLAVPLTITQQQQGSGSAGANGSGTSGQVARSSHAARRALDRDTGGTRIPPEVYSLMPRHDGRTLCLRFISKRKCSGLEGNPDVCTVQGRGHFTPMPLPKLVRDYVIKQFGGLRADLE